VPVPAPVFMPADEAPTESLVSGTMGDRCVNCGAPLSTDQRYCINCGERRGAARFTLPVAGAASADPAPSSPSRPPRSRRPRPSQGATLVAGIGTLLLAMGVGVLIGHGSSGTKTVSSPRAQVITVNAGGGGASSAAASTTATSQSSTSAGSKHSKKSGGGGSKGKASHKTKHTASTTPKATKQEAAAAQSAANKVTGGSDVNNAPVTVTSGQSCSGQGCQGGKFTGNFFGGGG